MEGEETEDRVNLADNLGTPMRPMKNTLVLAFSFLGVYTAFQGIQNIQSSINQEEGLGVASLACIYASLIVTSVLSPVYIYFIGLKMTFVLAFLSHCLYTASNFYPTWATLIPSSVLLGLAVSPMWIGRNLYVNGMGLYKSKTSETDLHGSLSSYNGIFFSIFAFAQVSGNFISSVVLHQSSTDQSHSNETKICGADDCPGNVNGTTTIIRPDTEVINTLLGIYLACGLLGLFTTIIFLRPLGMANTERRQLVRRLVACCTVIREKKLVLLIPLTLSQAVNVSIMLTGFTKAFVSCTVGVKMVGYVMMCYGIVSALSAVCFGQLAKYTGRRPLIAATLIADIVTLVALLLWKPTAEQVVFLFLAPCVWAIGDGIWMSQIMSLVAMIFPSNQPAAFSHIGTWGHFGFTFVLVSDKILCLRTKFYIAIGLWAAGVIGYIIVEVLVARETKQNSVEYDRIDEDEDHVLEFSRLQEPETDRSDTK